MSEQLATIRLFPAFGAEDAPELTDQYHRMMWYLYPVIDRIKEIRIAVVEGTAPGTLPNYLDPSIAALVEQFRPLVRIVDPAELDDAAKPEDFVLQWRTKETVPASLSICSVEDIDRFAHVEECQVYLNLSSKIGKSYSLDVADSHAKFNELVARHKREKCYIFGTGPNLSSIADHDFSDGVAIACNSMVRNTALLDRMQPPLIVAGDPIFHAGASVYAAEFRAALYAAMERYDACFMTNQRDYRIFKAHMPPHLRDRLIGAPADWGLRMNPDPVENFFFTACPNILTLFLIPLAHAFGSNEIWIAGCDGRSLLDNKYFWSHDKSVQFNDKMKDIQVAHPSFFDISYDDYYYLHCETVRHWVESCESRRRKVVNMTPSYIPALKARFMPQPGSTVSNVAEKVPFLVDLRMRLVFLQRQKSVLRATVPARAKAAFRRIFA